MNANGQATHAPTAAELRLEELQDKRKALLEAREERQKLTPEEQVAIAERVLAAEEALDALEAKEGKIGVHIQIVRIDDDNDGRAIILKRPIMQVFRRYQDSGKTDSEDLEKLVRPCLLYPTKPEFEQIIKDLPFVLHRCSNVVATLAGVRREDVAGK